MDPTLRVPLIAISEYASVESTGRLVIAGVMEGISLWRPLGALTLPGAALELPPFYMTAVIEASILDGTHHDLGLAIVDEDRKSVSPLRKIGDFAFRLNPTGRPMRAQVIIRMQDLTVPGPGDYELVLHIDGVERAATSLVVTVEELQAQA